MDVRFVSHDEMIECKGKKIDYHHVEYRERSPCGIQREITMWNTERERSPCGIQREREITIWNTERDHHVEYRERMSRSPM